MADLRWILLLVGLAFLAALAAWESRRPRQGRSDALNRADRADRGEPAIGDIEQADASCVSDPVPMPSIPMRASFNNPRVRVMVPVRVELPPLDPEDVADDEYFGAAAADVGAAERGGTPAGGAPVFSVDPLEALRVDEPMVALPDSQIVVPTIHPHEASDSQREPQLEQPLEPQPAAAAAPLAPTVESTVVPIVEWPPESQRHVISVRVVGVNSDRMSGRPLRQALAACGFVHGRFGIFHQPGVDGRALLSAANLNKPGVFDPVSMDFQRFRGLGLFAVLPGPLPPAAALDHLLDTAADLAQRLHARLLDGQGQPLDEERLEALARTVHGMSNSMLRSEPAA